MSGSPLGLEISPATADDAPAAAALLHVAFEDRVVTAAGIRYRFASAVPEDRQAYWKAERGGELVGWAYAGLEAFAAAANRAFAGVVVHPGHRRRGIGSALWDTASAHLHQIGASHVIAHSRADEDTRRFVESRGFSLSATVRSSAVDPRELPPPPVPPPGIEVVPLSAFSDDPELLYVADRESAMDEPGPFELSGMTIESWRRLYWDQPHLDRELGVAAVADARVVASTFVFADRETGRAMNGGTGVVRDHRGRGLGLLVKQHSLARVAAAGITIVIAQNDDTNAPMLAINGRLGYRPFAVGHVWVLER